MKNSYGIRPACLAALLCMSGGGAHAYVDGAGSDFIVDAPWRTIRDYVPVLFFAPDVRGVTIERLSLSMFDLVRDVATGEIFADSLSGEDRLSCTGRGERHDIRLIDDQGRVRQPMQAGEVASHWHYIAQIPTACLGQAGRVGEPGVHHLQGRIELADGKIITRVLRVVVDPDAGLPFFHPMDQYFDGHFHTIAEQTRGNILDIDTALKAFGGPLVMMVESAYAIGMLGRGIERGDWASFRNRLAVTDHNVFYSGRLFDRGGAPRFGPTRGLDGHEEEFHWHRETFGDLAGEELTLSGTGRLIASGVADYGSHMLAFGGPHLDGPWHGGGLRLDEAVKPELKPYSNIPGLDALALILLRALAEVPEGVSNPWDMAAALSTIGSTNGFSFAAHPFQNRFGWPREYFDIALGYSMFGATRSDGAQVTADGHGFVFKGIQVWNGKEEFATDERLSTHMLDSLNPFSPVGAGRFVSRVSPIDPDRNWLTGIEGGYAEYLDHVAAGLRFSFDDRRGFRFSRKIFMVAGTDAHGDFNFATGIPASVIPEVLENFEVAGRTVLDLIGREGVPIVSMDSNAFGRVRTYTLVEDRQIRPGDAVTEDDAAPFVVGAEGEFHSDAAGTQGAEAFASGNSVMTDGPICIFHLDANCRFDSTIDASAWHDATCQFENADGAIGGAGRFDGGRTALIPRHFIGDEHQVAIQTRWKGRNPYLYSQQDNSDMALELILRTPGSRGERALPAGIEGRAMVTMDDGFLTPRRVNDPAAVLLRGMRGEGVEMSMCLTNPIWMVPYSLNITAPDRCPIAPGALRIIAQFGASMEPTIREPCTECVVGDGRPYFGAEVVLYALDGQGRNTGDPVHLRRERWGPFNPTPSGARVENAVLIASNASTIRCSAGWDAESHSPRRQSSSYAVMIRDLHDMNLNRMNDIGQAFSTLTPFANDNVAPEPGPVAPAGRVIPSRPVAPDAAVGGTRATED
ncbi:hypothetical protein [Pararhodobacter sp. SW119]|uniref:hypothetical protein n=1 Tax=Pararhodobacter sp. SW119 TaxID=2780075 RepID=UPI001ADF11AF|nr:hypothetical protein [Pararhodobacter sp. SW119]